MKKVRLDELLVARGLCESRTRAQGLILAGQVRSGTEVLDKPGKAVDPARPLELVAGPRFVGRGGEKLEAFLEHFAVAVVGRTALDVGASTGGFTDCLLQRGAARVTCVDVGYGQLHARLRGDPRVRNLERVNARHLAAPEWSPGAFEVVVMDLSFISLRQVLPSVWPLLAPGGVLVALVKPQFEASRAEASRGRGVIRDPAVQARVLEEIRSFARAELPGAGEIGWIESPLRGGDGNLEYLAGWRREGAPAADSPILGLP